MRRIYDEVACEQSEAWRRPCMNRKSSTPSLATTSNPIPSRAIVSGVDEFTRSTLLKLLLHEAEKSCATRQQLDRIDRHMAALRQLIYRQVELVEKGHNAKRALRLLATMNDLMANYQTLHQKISPSG
jgi:hypothetical protein